MTFLSAFTNPPFNENFIQQLIMLPLPVTSDRFEVVDFCAALASVMPSADVCCMP